MRLVKNLPMSEDELLILESGAHEACKNTVWLRGRLRRRSRSRSGTSKGPVYENSAENRGSGMDESTYRDIDAGLK